MAEEDLLSAKEAVKQESEKFIDAQNAEESNIAKKDAFEQNNDFFGGDDFFGNRGFGGGFSAFDGFRRR